MLGDGLSNLERVKRVLALYAEGGAVTPLILQVGVKFTDFYKVLRENPSLQQQYYMIQKDRADMMIDETYVDSMDENQKDAKLLRVRSDIKMRVAGYYDRKRFGDKVQVEIDTGPDLTAALLAARQRTALPIRDPVNTSPIIDAAFKEITGHRATDKQSVSGVVEGEISESPDPFAD